MNINIKGVKFSQYDNLIRKKRVSQCLKTHKPVAKMKRNVCIYNKIQKETVIKSPTCFSFCRIRFPDIRLLSKGICSYNQFTQGKRSLHKSEKWECFRDFTLDIHLILIQSHCFELYSKCL